MSGSILERGPDVRATTPRHPGEVAAPDLAPLVDPRRGDVGDDTASTKQRSLLSIAGSLLIEISLPKLLFSVTMLLLLPTVVLGMVPLMLTAWAATVSSHLLQLTEISAALTGVLLIAL